MYKFYFLLIYVNTVNKNLLPLNSKITYQFEAECLLYTILALQKAVASATTNQLVYKMQEILSVLCAPQT